MVTANRKESFLNIQPCPMDGNKMDALRKNTIAVALLAFKELPDCQEKTIALTKLEEFLMWAIKSLCLNPVTPVLSRIDLSPLGGSREAMMSDRTQINKQINSFQVEQAQKVLDELLVNFKQEAQDILDAATQTAQATLNLNTKETAKSSKA